MEELKPIAAWACGHCNEIHRTSLQARVCCGNKSCVTEDAYICPTCGEAHRGSDDALMCCMPQRTIADLRTENAWLKERCEAYRELVEALEEYSKTESDNLYARIPGSFGLGRADRKELSKLQTAHDNSMNQLKQARAKLAALEGGN